jgi:hypothetical protein
MLLLLWAVPALSGLVPTPFGERPAECVLTLPHGATVQQPDLSMTSEAVAVLLADGRSTTFAIPPSCHEDGIAEKYLQRRARVLQPSSRHNGTSLPPDGWYDNAFIWHYIIDEHKYSKFTATYTVPTDPPKVGKQTLYYFIGLQDEGQDLNILQPVLAWCSPGSACEDTPKWSISSWACCPQNITFRSTPLLGLHSNDTVDVSVARTGAASWAINAHWQEQNTTLNAHVGSYSYNYADVTLEVPSTRKLLIATRFLRAARASGEVGLARCRCTRSAIVTNFPPPCASASWRCTTNRGS